MTNVITSTKTLSIENREWNQRQKQFFDGRPHKRMWYNPRSHFVKTILQRFISFAELSVNDGILEIGCGAGRYTIPLSLLGYEITGIDHSVSMLSKLEEDVQRLNTAKTQINVIQGDIDSFSADLSFKTVIGFNVLHHLFDLNVSIKRVRAVLKDGGKAVFVEPNARNPLHRIDSMLDGASHAERNQKRSLPEFVAESFRSNGFGKVSFLRFGFFPPNIMNAIPMLSGFERKLERINWMELYRPYFMIKAEKD